MTSLIERITGSADDTEDAPMTTPRQGYPAAAGTVPWWAGVPGLDPACPAPADPDLAARIAAEACARQVYGPGAAAGPLFGRSPAQKYLDWLLKAGPDDVEAWVRRYALRRACDYAATIGADDILDAAGETAAFVSPGRRR